MKYQRKVNRGPWTRWKTRLEMAWVILTYRHVSVIALTDKTKGSPVPFLGWQGFDNDQIFNVIKIHLEDMERHQKVEKVEEALKEMKASGSQTIP